MAATPVRRRLCHATHGGQVGKKGRFLPSIVQQAIMSVLTTEHQTGLSV